ncbi:glycosyltransferase family 2 protein [Brumimicrobium oceani]|uniref:Glycosyl transferase family 2 n=1 Tax=Brumimicrobium oceani TaxID=2100725 RepID=A0A2U2XCB3_9FLAO|nr:glycosyltransferase [Brumimicrobium oceani]PWH85418.1 glycosyl transferase family 2 [Brumimicrobium oceani]
MEGTIYLYQYLIFFYSFLMTVIYISLAILGYVNIVRNKRKYTTKEEEDLLLLPEIAPGISVVAPAYNEEVIIIENVRSLLNLDYPNFEIVIVNDGSKDKTLDLLIEEFDLIPIPFPYIQKVICKPVKKIYRSSNSRFSRLTVVDKVNGGTKADAMNAGINVAQYDYFINTDVDCLLARDTLTKCILPVLDSKIRVIAVGATLRMVNNCEVKDGEITRVKPPKAFIPTFQETEYLRSYLLAKMGWSMFNLIPNVSGGFGLFYRPLIIDAGGYDPLSHAEDMDMTLRIIANMKDNKKKYKIVQIPDTLCWTEGPPNMKVLQRQRSRWGRGLLQIFVVHRKLLFNRKYGRMGLWVMPYALIFEFLAPLIEVIGLAFMIFLLFTNQINFDTFWLMLFFVYLLGVTISLVAISFDILTKKHYQSYTEYIRLVIFSSLEAVLYHPLIVVFSINGYFQFLTRKDFSWGAMTRQGFKQSETPTVTQPANPE